MISRSTSSAAARGATRAFVLFPLGKTRFALPADSVTELARPDRLQSFPHTGALLSGVLVRRGKIVPVLDIAGVLVGPSSPPRKFYLIARRQFGTESELTAVPVSGECTLANQEPLPATPGSPDYVAGLLSLEEDIVQIVDLEKLAAGEARV